MKIKLRKTFRYTFDNVVVHELTIGNEYEVPKDISKEAATLALEFGAAVIVPKPKLAAKKAPEDKKVKAKETK